MNTSNLKNIRTIFAGVAILLGSSGVVGQPERSWTVGLGSPVFASPQVQDLDHNGFAEILVSSLAGDVYLLDHEGVSMDGWPQKVAPFQRTSPVAGDIDGDGKLEIVIGDDQGLLHAWEQTGEYVSGFPIQLEGTFKSVVRFVDVEGDGAAEILLHSGESRLYLVDGKGVDLPGWPIDLGGEPDIFGSWTIASTPLLVDLDEDGEVEVAVGTTRGDVQVYQLDGTLVDGWPAATGGWVYSSPVTADLDQDGSAELLAGSGDGKLYAWSSDGNLKEGFPVDLGEAVVASVAVGDLVGDERPELVVAGLDGSVFCFSGQGEALDGWPKDLGASIVASPLIADVDSDREPEIVVSSRDNLVRIWDANGRELAGASLEATDWIESTPVIEDLDADGSLELLYASFDGSLYCVELLAEAHGSATVWNSFLDLSDLSRSVSSVDDMDGDGLLDSFELAVFGDLSRKANGDEDQDGFNNYAEWRAGTDPLSAMDNLKVELAVAQIEGQAMLELRWQGNAQCAYRVYRATSPDSEGKAWALVSGDDPIVALDDQVLTWSQALNSGNGGTFFRIAVDR